MITDSCGDGVRYEIIFVPFSCLANYYFSYVLWYVISLFDVSFFFFCYFGLRFSLRQWNVYYLWIDIRLLVSKLVLHDVLYRIMETIFEMLCIWKDIWCREGLFSNLVELILYWRSGHMVTYYYLHDIYNWIFFEAILNW